VAFIGTFSQHSQSRKLMKIKLSDLEPFKEICRKICLNIPASYSWTWDQKRKMAAVILKEEDAEMVFYPLFKEFRNHWNFSSINEAAEAVNNYIHTEYGLMPGQVFFTSHMVCNLVLGVAWWPWGNSDKVSMRVGLIPINTKLSDEFPFQCLSRWLNITEQCPA
jgi:hypothetical protein